MKKKSKLYVVAIVSVLLAVLIGFVVGYSDLFPLMWLGVFTGITLIIAALTGLIDLVRRTRYYIYPGICLLILAIGLIISINITQLRQKEIHGVAQSVIAELESYKEKNGNYPSELMDISEIKIPDYFSYSIDPDNMTFKLTYSTDGWHHKVYDSKVKEWIVTD